MDTRAATTAPRTAFRTPDRSGAPAGRRALPRAAVAAALLAASACSGQPGSVPEPGAPGASAAADDTSTAALQIQEDTAVGAVLADGDGYTLYRFAQDGTEPPASVCAGDCAQQWPPAAGGDDGPTADDGIDAGLAATLERDDGATQLAFDGAPLYRYAGDVVPGDVNGQGVGGAWFAAAPGGGVNDADAGHGPGQATPRSEGDDGTRGSGGTEEEGTGGAPGY